MADVERLAEVDHLRLQLVECRAQLARSQSESAVLRFELERYRIGSAYHLVDADSIDLPSGVITRRLDKDAGLTP